MPLFPKEHHALFVKMKLGDAMQVILEVSYILIISII